MTTWYTYKIEPMDNRGAHLKTVGDTAAELEAAAGGAGVESGGRGAGESPERDDFLGLWKHAQQLARDEGWNGKSQRPPLVFWLPGEGKVVCGFVIKQHSDGTTYVVSPVALPHLVRG